MREGLGTYSSGFMPGHRIDNPLLRPQAAMPHPAGDSGASDEAHDRLPRSWTQYENNSDWEAPDQHGTAPLLAC